MVGILLLGLALPAADAAGGVDALVAQIKAVGREGRGNVRVSEAWRRLVQRGPEALPCILTGFDGADPIAANWLRAAVDTIAERTRAAGQPLPGAELETFLRHREHSAAARRLAYEWLVQLDPKAPERLLPAMLDDPSPELRRDAVARVLDEARREQARGDQARATAAYRKAFAGALDRDQVDESARELRARGVPVDVAAHFGFLRRWLLVGPFDNTGGAGFRKVFPPEQGVDLAATYPGKGGKTVRWIAYRSADPYGVVDLNQGIGKQRGAVAYAFAAVRVEVGQPVQLRAGSENAIRIFLNGRLLFSRDEYHHGMALDQHVAIGTLQPGRNTLLVKVCQNEQTDDWAQTWSFQLRLCDAAGRPVPLTVLPEKPELRTEERKAGR